jgi:hypothetical protein
MGSNYGVKLFAFAYRIFPISKPIGPVVWIATNHGDKGVGDEPYHKEDLEDGKVKLGSSKIPDREPVEPTTTLRLALTRTFIGVGDLRINHETNHYNCSHWNLVGPVGKKHIDCRDFIRDSEG